MILYHGSNEDFGEFKIGRELLKSNESNLVEGIGVYLTDDMDMANSYGQKVYVVGVDTEDLSDMTDYEEVHDIVHNTLYKAGIENMGRYIGIDEIVYSVLKGELSCTQLHGELILHLDNNEEFHLDYGNTEEIIEKIEEIYKEEIKDVIKYYDKSFRKSMYICHKNPEKLKILGIHTMR